MNRSTPLARTGGLTRGAPIRYRRAPLTGPEAAAHAAVMARANGRCEACQRPVDVLDYSHRVGAAQGGPVTVENGLGLCRRCHDWCGENVEAAVAAGLMLRGWQDPTVEPVWVHVRDGWLPDFGWWLPTVDEGGPLWVSWDGDRPPPLAYPCRAGLQGVSGRPGTVNP